MKRALHFAAELNSRDFKKCNCFWAPSYDLLASARKAVFPAPTATGVQRLRIPWSSLWEVIFFLTEFVTDRSEGLEQVIKRGHFNDRYSSSSVIFISTRLQTSGIIKHFHQCNIRKKYNISLKAMYGMGSCYNIQMLLTRKKRLN